MRIITQSLAVVGVFGIMTSTALAGSGVALLDNIQAASLTPTEMSAVVGEGYYVPTPCTCDCNPAFGPGNPGNYKAVGNAGESPNGSGKFLAGSQTIQNGTNGRAGASAM